MSHCLMTISLLLPLQLNKAKTFTHLISLGYLSVTQWLEFSCWLSAQNARRANSNIHSLSLITQIALRHLDCLYNYHG